MLLIDVFVVIKNTQDKKYQLIDGYIDTDLSLTDEVFTIYNDAASKHINTQIASYFVDADLDSHLEPVNINRIISYQREWDTIYGGMSARLECSCNKALKEGSILYKKYNDEEILVEYDLFFNELRTNCRFIMSDETSSHIFHNIISMIKELDSDAKIFMYTGGVKKHDQEWHMHSDSVWIKTVLSLDTIHNCFASADKEGNYILPNEIRMLRNEDISSQLKYMIRGKCILDSIGDYNLLNDIEDIKYLHWL